MTPDFFGDCLFLQAKVCCVIPARFVTQLSAFFLVKGTGEFGVPSGDEGQCGLGIGDWGVQCEKLWNGQQSPPKERKFSQSPVASPPTTARPFMSQYCRRVLLRRYLAVHHPIKDCRGGILSATW